MWLGDFVREISVRNEGFAVKYIQRMVIRSALLQQQDKHLIEHFYINVGRGVEFSGKSYITKQ